MTSLRTHARRVWTTLRDAAQSDRGRRVLGVLRVVLTVAVLGYLVYQMTTIGWGRIWRSLPTTPWFYVIFVALYFLLPLFQALAYRLIWGTPFTSVFPPILKAAVYNKEVLNYSGEMYLFSWARTHVDFSSREIGHHIKDNAILSSVASTLNAVLLVSFFVVSGMISLPFLVGNNLVYATGGVLAAILLIVVAVRFRRAVFQLSGALMLSIFGLYMVRLLLLQGLQVTQWAVVIPEVPLETWFTFLAVQIILNRLPFLPNQDLIFMAVGLEMAGPVNVPQATMAGILAVHSVLDKGLGVVLFGLVSWLNRDAITPDDLSGDALGGDEVGGNEGDRDDPDAPLPVDDASPTDPAQTTPADSLSSSD